MIAYLEPFQFLGTLITGVGLGMMLARAYDAVQHRLRMKRIRRNVVAYAETLWPPLPIELTTQTSGPEAAPANRDPQEPTPTSVTPGVAVPADSSLTGLQSADAGEGVAPPVRSFTPTMPWDGPWDVDFTGGVKR